MCSAIGQLDHPHSITIDSLDNIYVADTRNNRVQKFSSEGVFLALWGKYGTNASQFDAPFGITIDKSDRVFVTDTNNHRIQVFNNDGTLIEIFGTSGYDKKSFWYPKGIFADRSGKIYIADTGNRAVKLYRFKREISIQIPLNTSWNLISIPLEFPNPSIQNVLSQIREDVMSVWEYDPINGWKYCYFLDSENTVGELKKIDSGKGYWIDMVRPRTLEVKGFEPDDFDIFLNKGWNLVGCKGIISTKLCNALSCINGKYNSIWIYDNIYGRLKNIMDNPYGNPLEYELCIYEGFWIEAKEDCIWNINHCKH